MLCENNLRKKSFLQGKKSQQPLLTDLATELEHEQSLREEKKMRHQFLRANAHSHSSMSSGVTFTSKLTHGNHIAVTVRG